MSVLYDARGNRYVVAAPAALGLSASAAALAAAPVDWASTAVRRACGDPPRSDGLLVGPFQDRPPFDLLIVNTDGGLAERSGNGLTIFACAMARAGRVGGDAFVLTVHHDKPGGSTPARLQAARVDGDDGFWVEMGAPAFGADAVAAVGGFAVTSLGGRPLVRVARLATIDPAWSHSLFVRIGNPHCVTIMPDPALLPSRERLEALRHALGRVAYAAGPVGDGEPCAAGINLQWAALDGTDVVAARVFERGEGPTASSGTSAVAIASAIWHLGLADGERLAVRMPGGVLPVERRGGQVRLFGSARPA